MTTTPESWEQQLHDAANALDDTTLSTSDRLRDRIAEALARHRLEAAKAGLDPEPGSRVADEQVDAVMRVVGPEWKWLQELADRWCRIAMNTARKSHEPGRFIPREWGDITPEDYQDTTAEEQDAANTIPDTETTPGSLREQIVAALMRVESWYQPTEMHHRQADAVLRVVDPLLREIDEARLELTRWQSMFGDVDTAQARLDGLEAIAAELRDRAERAEAEVRHHIDAGQRDDEKITALTAERAALWHLLRKQTRRMRTWRRRANEAIADAVEDAGRYMQRARQLRRELDEARAEVERLREPASVALDAVLDDIDPRLLDVIRDLGGTYGSLGVALAAATLTDTDVLVHQLTHAEPEPHDEPAPATDTTPVPTTEES